MLHGEAYACRSIGAPADEVCMDNTRKAAAKRISPAAYGALSDALAVIFWNKRPFEKFLRRSLHRHPELLAGLDFSDLKRATADELVDRLQANEDRYQDVALELMLEVAGMKTFSNLAEQTDSEQLVRNAKAAVHELRSHTERYREAIEEGTRLSEELAEFRRQSEQGQGFTRSLEEFKREFLDLTASDDPHGRGRLFEGFLNKLFTLFDMEPRLAYDLEREQIDGSLSFDTDDYIVEARWRQDPTDRGDCDIFANKVRRKGKNALGIFVSVNGFTGDALQEYSHSTPFVVMDGDDLFCVLDQRVRLDDLLKRKKRHANETGSCNFKARQMIGD